MAEITLDLEPAIHDFDRQDSESWSKTSFTMWGYVQWLTPLLPTTFQLRGIEDRRALCDSIRNNSTHLFDRVRKIEAPLLRVARIVVIVATYLFINLALAPVGDRLPSCANIQIQCSLAFSNKQKSRPFSSS